MQETKKTVWLFDDNLMTASRVAAQIERAGCDVQMRKTPPTDSATGAPDLVLINLGSRSMNGVAVIEECKKYFPAARVVGYCGHLEIELRRAAKAAGVDKLITNEQALGELNRYL
jgi:DNA-binding NarL/FixJ family response regulator